MKCVVTSFSAPSDPTSGLTYNIWDNDLSFDYSQSWVQDPACGHPYTESFTWTGLGTYVVQDTSNPGRINVNAKVTSAKGTYAVTLQNDIVIADNGGSSTTFAKANNG